MRAINSQPYLHKTGCNILTTKVSCLFRRKKLWHVKTTNHIVLWVFRNTSLIDLQENFSKTQQIKTNSDW